MAASCIHSSVDALPPATEDTCERLRAARLRTTAPRLRVLQMLEAATEPMPAEVLFRRLIARGVRIGMGTVYRVLADLSTAQMVQRVWVPGHAGAKAAYSLLRPSPVENAAAHRLVCRHCGHCESFVDPGLQERLCQSAVLRALGERPQALTIVAECLGNGEGCSARGHDHALPATWQREASEGGCHPHAD